MDKPSRPYQSRIIVTTPRCHSCSFPCNRTPLKHILSSGQASPHECPRALAHLENSTPSMVPIPMRILGRQRDQTPLYTRNVPTLHGLDDSIAHPQSDAPCPLYG